MLDNVSKALEKTPTDGKDYRNAPLRVFLHSHIIQTAYQHIASSVKIVVYLLGYIQCS